MAAHAAKTDLSFKSPAENNRENNECPKTNAIVNAVQVLIQLLVQLGGAADPDLSLLKNCKSLLTSVNPNKFRLTVWKGGKSREAQVAASLARLTARNVTYTGSPFVHSIYLENDSQAL